MPAIKHNINLRDLPSQVTRSELSKFLDISVATIDRWQEKGRIPKATKHFTNRVFDRDTLIPALRRLPHFASK